MPVAAIQIDVLDIKTKRNHHSFKSSIVPRVGEYINIKNKDAQYKVIWVQWHVGHEETPCVHLWCKFDK